MRSTLFSLIAIPASVLTLGATVTVSVAYAVVAMVLGVAVLVFFLLLYRGIAPRIEWGRKKKKIWFERISSPK